MKGRSRSVLFAAVVATLALTAPSRADDPETARRAKVAIRVGAHAVTVGELEDRIAEIPPFQLATYGAARDEVVRAFVDQVFVRDLLLGAAAEQKKLDATFPTRSQILRAKSTATYRALRGSLSPASISADDVARYYADNRSHFEAPDRINLWRILCRSREEAVSVLAAAKRDLTIPAYNELAREHSTDKATNFRGGNLGFVRPDGTSNEAGVKVDPVLVKAAAAVRDGEFVPDPVPEGTGFAVVWRRTTVTATKKSLDDASAQIRTTLFRERTEAAEKKLLDGLREKDVHDVNADPLKIIEFPAIDAGFSPPRSASVPVPPRAPEPDPRPALPRAAEDAGH